MSSRAPVRVVTFKEATGFAYSASRGDVTVHGWCRGTKREAEAEARAHLRQALQQRDGSDA